MRIRHIFLFAISVLLVASCGTAKLRPDVPEDSPVFNAATDRVVLDHEFRGAWLTTVRGLDWPSADDDAATQQAKLRAMIQDIYDLGCNAVIFQVVSNQDAFYPSGNLPWSRVLTGTEGVNPGYDPLAVAVEACHGLGMEIHAWLNPLRLGAADLDHDILHPVRMHPEWVQTYGGTLYLDPALPEVRSHLADVVTELLAQYDLDGIHIDDYFYPYGLQTDPGTWDDAASYAAYGAGKSLSDWRYANINAVVRAMYEATHAASPTAYFGVSPGGRLENTCALYADPRMWIAEGTIDYLVPQIYWQHGHRIADFTTVLNSWAPVMGDVPMLTGLAAYRLGETGFESISEFYDQVHECRMAPWVQGHIWFRVEHLLGSAFRTFLQESAYPYRSLTPKFRGYAAPALAAPQVVSDGRALSWAPVDGAEGYAVYQLRRTARGSETWTGDLVYDGPSCSVAAAPGANYVVIARAYREKSDPSPVVYVE